ncbi:hypothetical protein [Methanosarcina sp. 1.H.A.2.2]|uniref:hypothetical protein n=1 Tax=Methanosarcina sp. 1.H.A.2.2 TaxID=1483601 RepID=UPI000B032864|nr:hypothetical protein [Methanosarcina sp. 1.H.A.2.2]
MGHENLSRELPEIRKSVFCMASVKKDSKQVWEGLMEASGDLRHVDVCFGC